MLGVCAVLDIDMLLVEVDATASCNGDTCVVFSVFEILLSLFSMKKKQFRLNYY